MQDRARVRAAHIEKAARAALVLTDDLCYEYGSTVCLMIANRAAKLYRRLTNDVKPSADDVKNGARSLQRYADMLEGWSGNYVRGMIHDQVTEEAAKCKD